MCTAGRFVLIEVNQENENKDIVYDSYYLLMSDYYSPNLSQIRKKPKGTRNWNGWNSENAEKSNGTLALANAGTHWIVLSRS